MEHLTGKDLRQLSEFLRELYQLRSHDEFTTHLVTTLPSITEGEFTSYNEIHPEAGTSAFKTDLTPFFRDSAHYADVLTRHAKTHPILVHMQQTKDGQPVMMSDFLPMRQFRETDLYNEFYRPLQIPHIIGFALAIDNHHSVTIARHRDGREFSEKTRTTLNTIRSHVLQGFRNAMAITHMQDQLAGLNRAMENARQALLAVTPGGWIKWATPSAYARMREYGFRVRNGSDWLPSRLREWMIHQQRQLDSPAEVATPMSPLKITCAPHHSQFVSSGTEVSRCCFWRNSGAHSTDKGFMHWDSLCEKRRFLTGSRRARRIRRSARFSASVHARCRNIWNESTVDWGWKTGTLLSEWPSMLCADQRSRTIPFTRGQIYASTASTVLPPSPLRAG